MLKKGRSRNTDITDFHEKFLKKIDPLCIDVQRQLRQIKVLDLKVQSDPHLPRHLTTTQSTA